MAGPNQQRHEYTDPPRDKFGKAGVSYPTPNDADYVVVEQLPLEKSQYDKLYYGKAHPEYPAAKLISKKRSVGDDNKLLVTRVYATNRQNQDAYNAAIAYTAQSGAHRVLTRSSLVLREGYVPLPDLTPDSANPLALCTQESATPAEAPYDTLYLRVTRVFETFGTRAEQDTWNRRDSLPYLLAAAPRITRIYRFPATYDPGFAVGTSTDGAVGAATLTSVARQDESARVRVYTCVFDSFPAADQQTGLGVKVEYPYLVTASGQRVTWIFRAKDAASVRAAYDSACPIPGYSNCKLISQTFDPSTEGTDQAFGGTATRVYEDILPAATGQNALGYSPSFPQGSTAYPLVVWRSRVLKTNYTPATGNEACPIPGFSTLVLTDQSAGPAGDSPDVLVVTREYQRLPGIVISSTDISRAPRQLTAIPAAFVNNEVLTTTAQIVAYGTPEDATTEVLLSSKVEAQGTLKAIKTNVYRPNTPLPTLLEAGFIGPANGASASILASVVPQNSGYTREFGVWDLRETAISPTQSERQVTVIDEFPALADNDSSRPADQFPGKYSSGGGGGKTALMAIVPVGGIPDFRLPLGYVELSRKGIDGVHERVVYGIQGVDNGTTELSGNEYGRFGAIAETWQLGQNAADSGLHVLSSQVSPAGATLMETVTRTSADNVTPTTLEKSPLAGVPERFYSHLGVTTKETPVAPGSTPDLDANVLKSEVVPTDNPFRAIKKTTALAEGLSVASLPALVGVDAQARDADGGSVTETEKVVVVGTPLDAVTFLTLAQKDQPLGNGLLLRTARKADGSEFPKLVLYSVFDPRLRVLMRETQQIVDAALVTQPLAPTGGASTEFRSLDKKRSIQIVRELFPPLSIPDEYGLAGYHRPALLTRFENFSSEGPDYPKLIIEREEPRSYAAQTRTVRTLGTGMANTALSAPILGNNVDYRGVRTSLQLSDYLTDLTIYIADGPDGLTIYPTSPTASGYRALAGTEIVFSSRVDDYHNGLQLKQVTYLTLQ